MERYFDSMADLGLRTVRLLTRALGLSPDALDAKFTKPMAAIRLLHYNDQVGAAHVAVEGRRRRRCHCMQDTRWTGECVLKMKRALKMRDLNVSDAGVGPWQWHLRRRGTQRLRHVSTHNPLHICTYTEPIAYRCAYNTAH